MLLLLLSRFSPVSDSVRPHRCQPTRLSHPWDSPGKHTGVGCYCLLRWMVIDHIKLKSIFNPLILYIIFIMEKTHIFPLYPN